MSVKVSTGALAFGIVLLSSGLAGAAEVPKQVTFSKDVAPILPGQVPVMPRARIDRADVAAHVPGSAPVGEVHQAARRGAADAAVACRPQRRRSEVQERHVAERRAGRHDRRAGSIRARSKAIRPTCRRSSRSTTTLFWQAERDGYGPPDLIVKSPEYTMPAFSQDRMVAADGRHRRPHRAAMGADGRNPSDQHPWAARSFITRSRTS